MLGCREGGRDKGILYIDICIDYRLIYVNISSDTYKSTYDIDCVWTQRGSSLLEFRMIYGTKNQKVSLKSKLG